MHPALHRKNTPSLALNKYLKILVFYFYYFLRIGFEFFHVWGVIRSGFLRVGGNEAKSVYL